MLRIVIADDHPVVLKGLKEILSESFDDVIIDGTTTGYELMNNVQKNQYDVKDRGNSPPPGPRQIPTSPALRWCFTAVSSDSVSSYRILLHFPTLSSS